MTKRYALKGVNDEESVCMVCGKVELKRVMWLVALDADGDESDDPFHVGTTCGANLLGYKQSKINTAVKNFAGEASKRRYALELRKATELGENTILTQLRGLSWKERTSHSLWAKLHEIKAVAKEWAEKQEISIEL